MHSRVRFFAIGLSLAFLCTLASGPARADRGHVRVTAPAHGHLGLAPTDGRGHYGAEIEGIVTAVDSGAGTISITDERLGDVVVTVDDSTVIRHGWTVMTLDQIVVGARVHVKAAPQDGGGYLAAAVFVQNNGSGGSEGSGTECDTEVQGTVTAIDCGANTMTVTTDSGDVDVTFDTSTQIFTKGHTPSTCGQIQVGDTVEVCGTQVDGSVLAAKVKFEAPEAPDTCEDEVSGVVDGTPDCGAGTLIVMTDASGEVTIALTDTTKYFGPHHTSAECADVADGDVVEIEGTLQGDGSIVACKVSFEPPEVEETEVSGAINGAPDGGAQTFVLTTDQGDVTIDVNSDTIIKEQHDLKTFADLADGMSVEVEGVLQDDGSILATKISIESGD
jgi:hypothetical protein